MDHGTRRDDATTRPADHSTLRTDASARSDIAATLFGETIRISGDAPPFPLLASALRLPATSLRLPAPSLRWLALTFLCLAPRVTSDAVCSGALAPRFRTRLSSPAGRTDATPIPPHASDSHASLDDLPRHGVLLGATRRRTREPHAPNSAASPQGTTRTTRVPPRTPRRATTPFLSSAPCAPSRTPGRPAREPRPRTTPSSSQTPTRTTWIPPSRVTSRAGSPRALATAHRAHRRRCDATRNCQRSASALDATGNSQPATISINLRTAAGAVS
jgi:hypothetical protein